MSRIYLTLCIFIFCISLGSLARHPAQFRDKTGMLNPILLDFQVNENSGPANAYQKIPCLATDGRGIVVMTWEDQRNGFNDIYAQRYSADGNPVGGNFRVNEEPGTTYQYSPAIAAFQDGHFIISWQDFRNRNHDIYAQLFSPAGEPIGNNFKVNDDDGSTMQGMPAITCDDNDKFIITWLDRRNGKYDIYAQIYSADGKAKGKNFKVNNDAAAVAWNTPAISSDGSGYIIFSWQDKRHGDGDIYAQRYASDGNSIGSNFKVNTDPGNAQQSHPAVCVDNNGSFMITWQDNRSGDTDIYAQRFAANGETQGDNFIVNDDQEHTDQYNPTIDTDSTGHSVITWYDNRNGNNDIYAQRYTTDGSATGDNFIVNTDTESADQINPWVSVDNSGNFVIIWEDSRQGDMDIYAQRYSTNGNRKDTNFKVNDDQQSAGQQSARISTDSAGNFVITWSDNRNGHSDIYAQRYSADGRPINSNFKVNDDQHKVMQCTPDIAMSSNGHFIVTWQDRRNGDDDIYVQRYSADGSTVGSNFRVNDDTGTAEQYRPGISSDSTGNFVIAWPDKRNGNFDIYAQRFSADGSKQGSNFIVNNDQKNAWQRNVAISTEPDGNFIITWWDGRNGNADIYAQRYSADGKTVGNNFRVNDDRGNAGQFLPAISTDSQGNYTIAWSDYRNGNSNNDIYAQRYSADGNKIGNNFRVNGDNGEWFQSSPSVSMNKHGQFIITWEEYTIIDWNVYGQRYLADGSPLGANFRVTTTGQNAQYLCDVAIFEDRIYNTWTDSRIEGVGFDIWANVLDWEKLTKIQDRDPSLNTDFRLHQNYPNPFNPGTTIRYELSRALVVEIAIYNMLGQKINVLEKTHKHPGVHAVQWNGTDEQGKSVPAGVYVCRINTRAFEQSIKLMLLK